jgi:nucleoid DNA-binding protein
VKKDSGDKAKSLPPVARADLIQLVRETLSISARDAREILDGLLQAIQEALDRGDDVRLPGLGKLESRVAPARVGRNPRTGESTAIKAQKKPFFVPSPSLRKRLAQTYGLSDENSGDLASQNGQIAPDSAPPRKFRDEGPAA